MPGCCSAKRNTPTPSPPALRSEGFEDDDKDEIETEAQSH